MMPTCPCCGHRWVEAKPLSAKAIREQEKDARIAAIRRRMYDRNNAMLEARQIDGHTYTRIAKDFGVSNCRARQVILSHASRLKRKLAIFATRHDLGALA